MSCATASISFRPKSSFMAVDRQGSKAKSNGAGHHYFLLPCSGYQKII